MELVVVKWRKMFGDGIYIVDDGKTVIEIRSGISPDPNNGKIDPDMSVIPNVPEEEIK